MITTDDMCLKYGVDEGVSFSSYFFLFLSVCTLTARLPGCHLLERSTRLGPHCANVFTALVAIKNLHTLVDEIWTPRHKLLRSNHNN